MNKGTQSWTKNSNYRIGTIQDGDKFSSVRYELGN
jgi:hypothetical protein